jgi:hypothetical protein
MTPALANNGGSLSDAFVNNLAHEFDDTNNRGLDRTLADVTTTKN